jgi:hypothetical protein
VGTRGDGGKADELEAVKRRGVDTELVWAVCEPVRTAVT